MPAAPSSTIPAAKAYLVARIAARTELADDITSGALLVSYDAPGPFQPDDIIAVMDANRTVNVTRVVGSGGAGWLSEKYLLAVIVSVYRGGDDAQTVFERASALADIVIDVVRQDPSLGDLVIQANPEESTYESEWATADLEETPHSDEVLNTGRLTTVSVPIAVHADL